LPELGEAWSYFTGVDHGPPSKRGRRRDKMGKLLLDRECGQCLRLIPNLPVLPAELRKNARVHSRVRQRGEVAQFAAGGKRLAAPNLALLRIAKPGQRKREP
jgi:hypothetical protein